MMTLDKMLKNIKNINYLLEVIYKAGIQKEKIVFIPNFERSTYAKVIEEINYKKDLLYIKINIFRLKFFSDLELIYFNHESKKDFNAVKLIETTISELLNIYLSNFLNIFSYQKKIMEYSFLNTLSINYVFKKVTKIIKSEYSCIYIEFSFKKKIIKNNFFILNKSILGYSIDTLKSKYTKPYGNINIYIYSDVQSILPSKINQINKISRDSFLDIKIILVYNRILGYIKI